MRCLDSSCMNRSLPSLPSLTSSSRTRSSALGLFTSTHIEVILSQRLLRPLPRYFMYSSFWKYITRLIRSLHLCLQGHACQRHLCCPTLNISLNGNGTLRKNGIHVSRRTVSIHNSRSPSTSQYSQRKIWGPGLTLSLEHLTRFPRPPIASTLVSVRNLPHSEDKAFLFSRIPLRRYRFI
ncbi:hypothetical protein BDR03DRAFT_941942 [Suillus americanus]|nr:hypothetical protein BDR03DRAFT_941942 [Suillus americanus]